jgi:hypothetical protein
MHLDRPHHFIFQLFVFQILDLLEFMISNLLLRYFFLFLISSKPIMTRQAMSSFKSSESRKVDSPATPKKPDTDSQWLAIERKEQSSAWLRDNEYILEGHPMSTYSYKKSLRLWRSLHMETINIWTHLLRSIAFIAVCLCFQAFFIKLNEHELHSQ